MQRRCRCVKRGPRGDKKRSCRLLPHAPVGKRFQRRKKRGTRRHEECVFRKCKRSKCRISTLFAAWREKAPMHLHAVFRCVVAKLRSPDRVGGHVGCHHQQPWSCDARGPDLTHPQPCTEEPHHRTVFRPGTSGSFKMTSLQPLKQ